VLIGYPTGWTLAVVDDPEAARTAAAALEAIGLPPEAVLLVDGPDAGERLRRLGTSTGPLARLRRSVQFMTMDQLPDLFVYEAALAERRPIVAVKVPSARRAEAVAVLRAHGAHFINSFGAWMTAEIEPWHGTMPPIPQHMQR
jgi:hypothetical protein